MTDPSSKILPPFHGFFAQWLAQRLSGIAAQGNHLTSAVVAGCNRNGFSKEAAMDKDRVKGAAHEAKGSVKEAVGKVTGDKKTQASGAAEKAGGKVQSAAGKVKDAVKGR